MKSSLFRIEGLSGEQLRLRYDPRQPFIVDGESLHIPRGRITALIGPNGSGKSTLLKALARQLLPESGKVLLDGREIATLPARALARKLGILFQERHAPGDLTLEELVFHGRYPYHGLFESISPEDRAAVDDALRMAGIAEWRHRPIGQLSGGQKQLAWIAMAVAQSPRYLLLDEPTTFLDLAHQFDVMDLLQRLNRELGMTIVLVVHDLNLAGRYAQFLVALREGKIFAAGRPEEVLTRETLRHVFEIETQIFPNETGDGVFCAPLKRVTTGGDSPAVSRGQAGRSHEVTRSGG